MPELGRFINPCTCIQEWLSYNVQNNQHLFFYFINWFKKQFLIHVGIKISFILSGVNAAMSCFHFMSGQSVSVISSEWKAPATSPHGCHYDQWHPYNWGNGLTMDFVIYINFPNITFTWKCTWFFFQLSFPIFLASLNLLGLKPENPGWNTSIPWLLISAALALIRCRTDKPLFSTKKDFNHLHRLSFEKWQM